MPKTDFKHAAILVLTALIWGFAFVAQTTGGDAIGPYSFACIRFILGGLVLLPTIKLLDHMGLSGQKPQTKEDWKTLFQGGLTCGVFLIGTSIFQQLGLYLGTPAGKAGFLTTCYIVLVPILGLFIGKKCSKLIWLAVGITLVGLYLLCMNGSFTLQLPDILVLICSLMCAIHILVVDHFVLRVDVVRMSCIQFFTAAAIAFFPMFFVEMQHSVSGILIWAQAFHSWEAWIPVLYAGILSSGVAYTLQNVGQLGVHPTIASLIMSLESVFSVLAGWLLLHQVLGIKELCGCALIFIAVVLAQIPTKEN